MTKRYKYVIYIDIRCNLIVYQYNNEEGGLLSMEKVASNVDVAKNAVLGIKNIEVDKGKTVSLTRSISSGTENGKEVTNNILNNIAELVHCVKKQATKFSKLAKIIEDRDKEVAFVGGDT